MLDPAPPHHQIVTSSELVRHFGYWQDRAARTPVYVLHRGRPRLVLTSVEIMDALCAPHFADQGCGPDLAAVLDRIEDRVLIANDRQQVIAASDTARRYFGPAVEPGHMLTRIVAEEQAVQLAAALDRVARTGIPVALDIAPRALPARDMTLLVHPWPGGLMLIARDATATSEAAERVAFDEALAANAEIAPARINLRGRLEAGHPVLAAWCDLGVDALASMPFASLFEPQSQGTVHDAVERVTRSEQPLQINALLLANRPAPYAVRIGLAPRRDGVSVCGVAAVLAPTTS